jgi:hypothetical protein
MVADSIAELAVTSQTASAPTFTADPTPPNGRKAENGGGVECACAGGAVCAFATGSPHDRGRDRQPARSWSRPAARTIVVANCGYASFACRGTTFFRRSGLIMRLCAT